MKSVPVSFIVDEIHGQGRPRFTTVCGHANCYENKSDTDFKEKVKVAYLEQTGGVDFGEKPLDMTISVYAELPKSTKKSITSEPNTFKPDADNIAKAIMDALNGVAYKDDSQIVRLTTYKYNRVRNPFPSGTHVMIYAVQGVGNESD